MSSSYNIGNFASGIWTDLGSPTNLSSLVISGWVSQDYTIGKLNNLTAQCFSGSGAAPGQGNYDVVPDLGAGEFAILDLLYRVNYYQNLVRSVAGAGGISSALPWTQLSEGDTKIARANPASLAKIYADMVKDLQEQLKYMVNAYNVNAQGSSTPRVVNYLDIFPVGFAPNYVARGNII